MTGESDDLCFWPNDPDFDGPYGYYVLIIQKDGFRLGCDAPFIPPKMPRTASPAARRSWPIFHAALGVSILKYQMPASSVVSRARKGTGIATPLTG